MNRPTASWLAPPSLRIARSRPDYEPDLGSSVPESDYESGGETSIFELGPEYAEL